MTELEAALGSRIVRTTPLAGGCVADVVRIELADGRRLVVKRDDGPDPRLEVEAEMLRALAGRLPVPRVEYATPRILAMEYVDGESSFTPGAEEHAADLLAALHAHRAERFGWARDTLIGGLVQRNGWRRRWLMFFRENRLLAMANEAHAAGRLPDSMRARIDVLASRLDEWIQEPAHPSLLHGDVWSGNVLARGDRIVAFLDPAISYGHPEIELAFVTLFSTFGERFFRRYAEHRPIASGFFEARRDLYNLWPLLVHVRLFGSAYVSQVDRTLRKFGA